MMTPAGARPISTRDCWRPAPP
ncbi:PF09998 domain protein, partial [Bordetella hinzii L60]